MSLNNVKKSIGWADFTANPVKGLCPVGCSFCYARRAYNRNCNDIFKDKSIRYDPSVFLDLYKAKKDDKIFVGSTIDLFHPLCSQWNDEIFNICERTRDNTFIFLTKCPQNLPRVFPDNCWVGVSIDLKRNKYGNTERVDPFAALDQLRQINAKVKILSFEPLLGELCIGYHPEWWAKEFKRCGISWVIIGAQTPFSPKTAPKIEWLKEIVGATNKAQIPIFLKDNLNPIFAANDCALYKQYRDTFFSFKDFLVGDKTSWHLRQEFPKVKGQ